MWVTTATGPAQAPQSSGSTSPSAPQKVVWWSRAAGTIGPMRPPSRPSPEPPATPANVEEFTLAELQTEPEVAAALDQAPALWRNCVVSDTPTGTLKDASLTRQELIHHVWLDAEDGTWTLTLGDECFSLFDLDNDSDPVLATMRDHADVAEAHHEDREVFVFSTTRSLTAAEAAVLAVQALTAGHVHALRAAGLGA